MQCNQTSTPWLSSGQHPNVTLSDQECTATARVATLSVSILNSNHARLAVAGPSPLRSLPPVSPMNSNALLSKLPLRVYKHLEEVINKCSHMDWRHFDAGVVKVGHPTTHRSDPPDAQLCIYA